ncbi:Phage late control gene D protein (GPD), partial [Paraburkholderia susongensis]
MFKLLQNRILSMSSDALPTWGNEPVLAPLRLSGTEALGRLYRYALDVATVESPTLGLWQAQERVVPDKLIGRVIDISIAFDGNGLSSPAMLDDSDAADADAGAGTSTGAGAASRTISGLITGVRQMGTDNRRAFYRLTVRPWLWLATKHCASRIFQDASVVEITDQLLSERYPYPVVMALGGPGLRQGYPKRD